MSTVGSPSGPEVAYRLATVDDLVAIRAVTASAFGDLERRLRPAGDLPKETGSEGWQLEEPFVRRVTTSDPDGCRVALVDGEVRGVALAIRREDVWVLGLLAVSPEAQNLGVGRGLLEQSLAYGGAVDHRYILSSEDHRAMRRYVRAGLSAHAMLLGKGRLDRSLLPASGGGVRDASESDRDLLAAIDRAAGTYAHPWEDMTMDLEVGGRILVYEGVDGRAYGVRNDEGLGQMAASSPAAAQRLAWELLGDWTSDKEVAMGPYRPGQDWGIDVAVQARLRLGFAGCFFHQGRVPGPLAVVNGLLA